MLINIGLINAQAGQGKILLGASSELGAPLRGSDFINFGYSSSRDKGDEPGFAETLPSKVMTISILPKVGYFVADNLALGLDLNYTLTTRRSGDDLNSRSSQRIINAGHFVRYYIPTTKVLPFFEVNSSFGRALDKWGNVNNGSLTINLASFGGGIGVAIPLTDRFAFDVLAAYSSVTQTSNQTIEQCKISE